MIRITRRPIRAGLVAGIVLLGLGSTVTAASAMTYARPPTGHEPPATVTPSVQASLHNNWAGVNKVPPNLRYQFTRKAHYSLHVTGANFVPNASVKISLLTATTRRVVYRAWAFAAPKLIYNPFQHTMLPNPLSGTIDYRASIRTLPTATSFQLQVQSTRYLEIHALPVE